MTARHVVITGGSSGLGKAIGQVYLTRGDHVTLIARNESRLAATRQTLAAQTGRAPETACCDVGAAAAMDELLISLNERRSVDVIIANAGIGGRDVMAPACGEPIKLAHRIHETNTLGVVNSIAPLLPAMTARRRGQIVIVGSVSSFVALPQCPVYCASKASAYTYGHALRRLLRGHGVQVTVVSPGFVDTPMSRSLPYQRPFLVDEEKAARLITRGIDRGRADIIFPWPFRVLAALSGMLPLWVMDQLIALSSKAAHQDSE